MTICTKKRNRPVPLVRLIIFLLPLLLAACNRTEIDCIPLSDDVPILTELPAKLKKSHLKIIPTEKTLVAERVVWFGLYYDGKRIAEKLEWESSDTDVLEFYYIYKKQGLYNAGFCRVPKKVTVRVTCQSVTVKRTFKIQSANRESGLQILLPEPREFLQGDKIDFTITYDGKNVTNEVMTYYTKHPEEPPLVYIFNTESKNSNALFCKTLGITTHIVTMRNDDTVFRTVTIRDEPPPMRIQIPEGVVFRPGRRVKLSAWLGDKDITETSEWEVFCARNESRLRAAELTDKKGEFLCMAKGMFFAFARYGEHTAFATIDVTK